MSIRALARRCGDATNAEVRCQFRKRKLEVNRRGLNTMSNNGDIRYCHKFSYVFLKFLLFFYAIVFWVSWAGFSRSVSQVGSLPGSLRGHVLWKDVWGSLFIYLTEMTCSAKQAEAGTNKYMLEAQVYDSHWSARCRHLWRADLLLLITLPHPSLLTFKWRNRLEKDWINRRLMAAKQ